jgi:protein SCO1/2
VRAAGQHARLRRVMRVLGRSNRSVTRLTTVLVGVLGLVFGLVSCGRAHMAAPSADFGYVFDQPRPVPATPLVDQYGRATTLRSFHGKFIVLAQFLTLCQEECPLTTGVFQQLQRSVQAAGLGREVVFVEVTVDPGRDTPARLRAYQQRFGADWQLLTGTLGNITKFWRHFGVYFQKVPEGRPPGTDWWTGKKLTYDIDHTNGFVLVDRSGNERFITQDMPDLHGQLPARLRSLLDAKGLGYLRHGVPGQSYTVQQALGALSWLVGRRVPLAGG